MKIICLTIAILSVSGSLFSQTGNVGIGTDAPQAKLHVNGDVRIDGLSTTTNANQVLTVDIVTNKLALMSSPVVAGDVKQGLQTADHSGWIKLDGRNLTALTSTQQTAAAGLGLSGSLPNATGAYLVQNGNALGNVSGGNTKTITRSNLPNVNFTGTTNTTGSHSHSYTDRGSTSWGDDVGSGNDIADNTSGSYTTGSAGNHFHTVTVNSGGSGSPLDITPRSLSVNTFIYLGN